MLNIVIPMAGSGSRFTQAGYAMPKPLVPVHGIPMIRLVIANVRPRGPHRFIFICREEHLREAGLEAKLKHWAGADSIVTSVPGLTEGAACTVLTVKSLIGGDAPMMLANCDQYIGARIDDYLAEQDRRGLGGMIMTLASDHPKWSYAALDGGGLVTRVAEKQVISNHATVGVYNYRHGRDFVAAAEAMIGKNLRVNGEFYTAPAYNEAIARGLRVGVYNIGANMDGMYGLGTPEDLEAFLALPLSRKVTAELDRTGAAS